MSVEGEVIEIEQKYGQNGRWDDNIVYVKIHLGKTRTKASTNRKLDKIKEKLFKKKVRIIPF